MITRSTQFIDGPWIESESTETIDVTDAGSGEVMATVPAGTSADVDKAVAAARAAFPAWSRLDVAERVGYLKLAAEELARRQNEVAALISREVGMPYPTSNVVQVCQGTAGSAHRRTWKLPVGGHEGVPGGGHESARWSATGMG